MKVRCGRCGAEYSEIRKVCPKCSQDTEFATYIEGALQGKTIFDTKKEVTSQQEEYLKVQPVERAQDEYQPIPSARKDREAQRELEGTGSYKSIQERALPPRVDSVATMPNRKKKKPIFLILLLIGIVWVVGKQNIDNYMMNRRVAQWRKPIPIEKLGVNEKLDLGNSYFTILNAEWVENDIMSQLIPEGKKVIAVKIKAEEIDYEKESKDISDWTFYGHYGEDDYVQPLTEPGLTSILETIGYPRFYMSSYEEEPGYLFFLVDKDIKHFTLVYTLLNETTLLGEYVEKLYETDLVIK